MLPRGIRNNNPGNIRIGDKWQGLQEKHLYTPEQEGETAFCVFKSPTWGIRALARVLISYQDKHDIKHIFGIINRWAPTTENDTTSYVSHVAARVGVGSFDTINVHEFATMYPLVEAIIQHENGMQPYTKSQITKGLVLAGVEPKEQDLKQSRTIKGAKVTTAGISLTAVAELATDIQLPLMQLEPYLPMVKWLLIAAMIVGIVVMVYARLDDKKKGLR